jgi:hypothetical protein
LLLQVDGGITASGIDSGLGHVVGAKRTDIPRELCVLFIFCTPYKSRTKLNDALKLCYNRHCSSRFHFNLIIFLFSYPRLQNCVATVDLDTKLNLREIVQSVHNAECVYAAEYFLLLSAHIEHCKNKNL